MDKLKLAHEMALAIQGTKLLHDMELVSEMAWKYADAMQAEADKRNKAEAAQKRKEIREMLNADNTFIEREGQHFDDVNECEVDWRVAPQDTTGWKIKEGRAYWIDSDGWIIEDAPSFGFTGSHIVERPDGF